MSSRPALTNANVNPQVGIDIAEAVQGSTSARIDLINKGEFSTLYKWKNNVPKYLTIEPCDVGLIEPGERKPFVIILEPGYERLHDYYLFLETVNCPNTEQGNPELDAATAWSKSVSSDLSVTRIALFILDKSKVDQSKVYCVNCGVNPDFLRKTIVERVKSNYERMRREDLTTDTLLLLLLLFGTGYVVGMMFRRCTFPNCRFIGQLCFSNHP